MKRTAKARKPKDAKAEKKKAKKPKAVGSSGTLSGRSSVATHTSKRARIRRENQDSLDEELELEFDDVRIARYRDQPAAAGAGDIERAHYHYCVTWVPAASAQRDARSGAPRDAPSAATPLWT